jgi:hypothetical protein
MLGRLCSGTIRALNCIVIDVGKSSACYPAQARGLGAAIDAQSGGATVGRPSGTGLSHSPTSVCLDMPAGHL